MMQIYIPGTTVAKNTAVLHENDLNAQRNCALTILEAIAGKGKGWMWHPGVRMWVGSEDLLGHIAVIINEEWAQQIASNNGEARSSMNGEVKKYHESLELLGFYPKLLFKQPDVMPWWWGHKRFHQGERSNLLRRNKEWYGQFFPKTASDLCEWFPKPGQRDQFVYGPQMGPNGDYSEFHLNDKPILKPAKRMSADEFAHHANVFHNLMPDIVTPISPKEPTLDILKSLHDRFHTKKVYHSHDHI